MYIHQIAIVHVCTDNVPRNSYFVEGLSLNISAIYCKHERGQPPGSFVSFILHYCVSDHLLNRDVELNVKGLTPYRRESGHKLLNAPSESL